MLHHFLINALRNVTRNKLVSTINIGGLAVGLACAIFVMMFIRDELSYDKWVPDTQSLYRVEKTSYLLGRKPFAIARIPFLVPAAMRDAIPEVTAMTRISYNRMTIFVGDRQFQENVADVDSNFFDIVKLPLFIGNPASVFKDPESLVLSESAARKYFGTTEAIGKIINTTANCEPADAACQTRLVPLKVTGIMRDIPANSHLDGDVFMSNTSIADRVGQGARRSWYEGGNGFGYVVLAPGAKPETVVSMMASVIDRAIPPEPGAQDQRRGSQRWAIHLTPFTDVHLTSSLWRFNEKPPGSWATVYGAGIVGFLVLFVACFNFMNLATALASLRAREIALRKALGANRAQLIAQFLGESVLTALMSLVVAMALVEVSQPAFGNLLQHSIAMPYDLAWLLLLVVIAVAVGLLSGAYPALVLSRFRPSAILRTGNMAQPDSGGLRKILVVLQFSVSIGLGIAVMVVFSQISFARNIDLGIRTENLLVVPTGGLVTLSGHESFVQRLRSNAGILDVAVTEAIPFGTYSLGLAAARLPGQSHDVAMNRLVIGAHTAQLLGMRLIAGRLFSESYAQDKFDASGASRPGANGPRNVLIDEAAATSLGFLPQRAVGKTIILGKNHVQVVGVVANVKFMGAGEPAMATFYVYDPKLSGSVLIRLRPGMVPQTLSFIDRVWHEFAPTRAGDRWFLRDVLGRQYGTAERQGYMLGVFVAVAIVLSCLGLFGLAAFTASLRTKEIGIRKACGARTRDVLALLLWQFSIPVLIANAIAWPLAWYFLHGWLEGFGYRISLSPLFFIGAGLFALVIAWATVFAHAILVASANPIHALRYE